MKKIMIFVLMVLVVWLAVYKLLPKKTKQIVPGKNEIVDKNEFSILLPNGWREVDPLAEGVMMSAIDNKISEDKKAKERNYRTNLNITFDKLEEKTVEEYTKFLQEEIKKIIAGVNFENEKENGFEAEVNQEGIDFKSKVVIYQGKQGDVWTISFNTTKSEWPKYSIIFNEILKNFSVKNNDKQI